jgi:hypothetical protein
LAVIEPPRQEHPEMTANLITSQHYISDEIVFEKIATGDFLVQVSPEFVVDGDAFRVVLDGHHSLRAAITAGVEPTIIQQDARENDRIAPLDAGDVDGFLEACWIDGEYIYAVSEKTVW